MEQGERESHYKIPPGTKYSVCTKTHSYAPEPGLGRETGDSGAGPAEDAHDTDG